MENNNNDKRLRNLEHAGPLTSLICYDLSIIDMHKINIASASEFSH